MPPGYVDFEFDLPGALLTRLVAVLDGMQAAELSGDNLSHVPEAQGVYQLFRGDQLSYIGKTDAEAGLKRRLERHRAKVQHRTGLHPLSIGFKAVRIYVFTAMDLETQLISHYGGMKALAWNRSGFGSNDPGHERETMEYKDDHFDLMHPIDIDKTLNIELSFPASAANILNQLRPAIPYTLRYEMASRRSRQPHSDLAKAIPITPKIVPTTTRTIMQFVVGHLPPGWQATRMPGYVILYKEAPRAYRFGETIAISPNSTT